MAEIDLGSDYGITTDSRDRTPLRWAALMIGFVAAAIVLWVIAPASAAAVAVTAVALLVILGAGAFWTLGRRSLDRG